MINLKISYLLMLLTLVSCAGMKEAWINQSCNYNAAYEKGSNDRDAGAKMNSGEYVNCPDPQKQEAIKGYHEGYERARQAENNNPTGTHIQFGGTQINLPGRNNGKAFYCTVEAFGTKYEAFGATKFEAIKSAQEKCKQKNAPMHCEDAVCTRNK